MCGGGPALPGVYAVGEAAGTHGVTRPGGAALNAGQVFATRAAEHIAARPADAPQEAHVSVVADVGAIMSLLRPQSALRAAAILEETQARMSDHAGVLCTGEAVAAALAAATRLNRAIEREGIAGDGATEALRALQARQTALAAEAVLTALNAYIQAGGGSRGARAILDPMGECCPRARPSRWRATVSAPSGSRIAPSR